MSIFQALLLTALVYFPATLAQHDVTSEVMYASKSMTATGRFADSVEVNGRCYCLTTFDHGIGSVMVGGRTVRSICGDIGPPPGPRSSWKFYNDIQCGNGPRNDAPDEKKCGGRIGMGPRGCTMRGPKWGTQGFVFAADTPGRKPQKKTPVRRVNKWNKKPAKQNGWKKPARPFSSVYKNRRRFKNTPKKKHNGRYNKKNRFRRTRKA